MVTAEQAVRTPDTEEQERYRRVLEQQGRPLRESAELLFGALGDPSWRVRKQAVELLISLSPGPDEQRRLITLLRDEENAGLRNAAAEALIRLGSPAVQELLEHLADDDHDLRKQVVDILGQIGGREVLPGLVRALSDPDLNVAAAAAEAVGMVGDGTAAPLLLQHLEKTTDLFFRFNALAALARIGQRGPLPQIIADLFEQDLLKQPVIACMARIGNDLGAVDLLLEGVQSYQPTIRQTAICSLAQVLRHSEPSLRQAMDLRLQAAADQGLVDLLNCAFSPGNLQVNEAIITILERLADPRSADLLLCALLDERLSSRARSALKALGEMAVEAAVLRFRAADSPAERAVLCSFLGWQGDLRGALTLQAALRDAASEVRAAAVIAAVRIPDPALHEQLVSLLDDPVAAVRDAVLHALRTSSDLPSGLLVQAAGRLAQSSVPDQRLGAAYLFANLRDINGLSILLNDEHAAVREAAARAAGRLGMTEGCSHLLSALVDEVPDVRIAAAESLGECSDRSAIHPLRLALEDPDSWVRAAVLRSLAQLAGSEILPDLLACWEHGDEVMQLACLEVGEQLDAPDFFVAVSRGLGKRDGEVLKVALDLLCCRDSSLLTPWLPHMLCHHDWDVRIAAVRASAVLDGQERQMLLQAALEREDNDLVRAEIRTVLNRE